SSPDYMGLERRTLVLALSDGARLDRLRRSSPFSHEQFHLVPELTDERIHSMVQKLSQALKAKALDQPATFRQIILADDFYGSGLTLLRRENHGWAGRLWKAEQQRSRLADMNALSPDVEFLIVVYVLAWQAKTHLDDLLPKAK